MGFDINGAISGKVAKVLTMLDLPWPGGDPGLLRDLAGHWTGMAHTLRSAASDLDGAVHNTVGSVWTGAAADAFAAHWKQQHDAFEQSATNFDEVAKELDAYADEAEQIVQMIVEIALEIAEIEIGGILLTAVTAGLSDLLSNAAVAERAGKIGELIQRFLTLVKRAEEAIEKLERAAERVSKLLKIFVEFVENSLKNTAMNFMGTKVSDLMTGKASGTTLDELKDAGYAGMGAAGLGALGRGAGLLADSGGAHAAPSRIDSVLGGFDKLVNTPEGEEAAALTAAQRIARARIAGGVTSAAGQSFDDWADGKSLGQNARDSLFSGATGAVGAGQAQKFHEPGSGAHAGPTKDIPGYDITRNGYTYGEGNVANSTLPTDNPFGSAPGGKDGGDTGAVVTEQG